MNPFCILDMFQNEKHREWFLWKERPLLLQDGWMWLKQDLNTNEKKSKDKVHMLSVDKSE